MIFRLSVLIYMQLWLFRHCMSFSGNEHAGIISVAESHNTLSLREVCYKFALPDDGKLSSQYLLDAIFRSVSGIIYLSGILGGFSRGKNELELTALLTATIIDNIMRTSDILSERKKRYFNAKIKKINGKRKKKKYKQYLQTDIRRSKTLKWELIISVVQIYFALCSMAVVFNIFDFGYANNVVISAALAAGCSYWLFAVFSFGNYRRAKKYEKQIDEEYSKLGVDINTKK